MPRFGVRILGGSQGWAYFINGNGYAGIEERPGSETHGCIWTLRESDWFALDQYEAVSEGFYERILLEVEVGADRFKPRSGYTCPLTVHMDDLLQITNGSWKRVAGKLDCRRST